MNAMDQQTTTAELKSMILTFRVNELQALLSYAGKNRTGKKNELLQRAMDLLRVRNISAPIQNKIKELHLNKPIYNCTNPTSSHQSLGPQCMPPSHETMINQSGPNNNSISHNNNNINSNNNSRMCNVVNRPDQNILTNINLAGIPDYFRTNLDTVYQLPNSLAATSRSMTQNQQIQPSGRAPIAHRTGSSMSQRVVHHHQQQQPQQHQAPIQPWHNHYRHHAQSINSHLSNQQQAHQFHPHINYALNNAQHQHLMPHQQQFANNAAPITKQSNVKFKALPFFPMIEEIIKPSNLSSSSRSLERINESTIAFCLTSSQADKVAMSALSTTPRQFSRQILLRFCHCDTIHSDQDDNFPPNVSLEVNRKQVELPPALHNPNKPDLKHVRRPGKHVDITPFCKLCPYTKNHIIIRWTGDAEKPHRTFAVTVVLVKRLNSDDLLRDIQSRGLTDQEQTRSMVKEKLRADADSEIATTVLRGTLMCPLGKIRMRIPCRSSQCYHIQCFDALLYLQMNERKSSWICPVCDNPALFKDLIIDGLFTDILKETPPGTTEVQFYENGSWSLVPKNEDSCSRDIKPPNAKRFCMESGGTSRSDGTTENLTKKPEIELVVISDSSDDEDEDKDDDKDEDKDDDDEDEESDETSSQSSGTVYSISSSPASEDYII